MIHYHGTPITPRSVLFDLAGKNFCVSYADPRDLEMVHQIGQSVMIDNGAFSYWKRNKLRDVPQDWKAYYSWVRPWLSYHTTWAVIPDVIDGTEEENDALIQEWRNHIGMMGMKAAPVWHIHESLERLDDLITSWPRICFGSSGAYAELHTPRWNNRMNKVFNHICRGNGHTPSWIHMLRGMSLSGSDYPFASVDSTDIARNHHVSRNDPVKMAHRWDAQQCPALWVRKSTQERLYEVQQAEDGTHQYQE